LGKGFNGIGIANVFWAFTIAGLSIYWIIQMRAQSKRGEQ